MEENNQANQGISSSLILIVLALIVLGVGVYYVVTQMGGVQLKQPSPTQFGGPSQYVTPSASPISGPAIQNVRDLDSASKTMNDINVDAGMDTDLNGLSSDSSSL
jgi:hypothetical protein